MAHLTGNDNHIVNTVDPLYNDTLNYDHLYNDILYNSNIGASSRENLSSRFAKGKTQIGLLSYRD